MTRKLVATLPYDSLHVLGRVNNKDTVWTNVRDNEWESVVNRSSDDIYHVELTIIKATGATSITDMTLYYGLHLITDRTQTDVDSRTSKGCYNASDLNRVGQAVVYVAEQLNAVGFHVPVQPKIDWMIDDVPTTTDMSKYIKELQRVRDALVLPQGSPKIPDNMDGLTYVDANNIEKMLLAVDDAINRVKAGWYYSGEIYAGEVY